MMLADMGAEVIFSSSAAQTILRHPCYPRMAQNRGKKSIALDLKSRGRTRRRLEADRVCRRALIEGFRPGVMERLGFSPRSRPPRAPAWSLAASPAGARPAPVPGRRP